MSSTTIISESKREENIAEEKVPDIPSSSSEDSEVETEGEILTDVDSTVSEDYVSIDDETRTTVECQTTSHMCGICYKELHLGNSVTTICKHEFCNKCFFFSTSVSLSALCFASSELRSAFRCPSFTCCAAFLLPTSFALILSAFPFALPTF